MRIQAIPAITLGILVCLPAFAQDAAQTYRHIQEEQAHRAADAFKHEQRETREAEQRFADEQRHDWNDAERRRAEHIHDYRSMHYDHWFAERQRQLVDKQHEIADLQARMAATPDWHQRHELERQLRHKYAELARIREQMAGGYPRQF